MKILAAVPCALLAVSILGCSQGAGTTTDASRAADSAGASRAPAAEVNTFGESKEPAADAAQAREHSFGGSDQDSGRQTTTPEAPSQPAPRQ